MSPRRLLALALAMILLPAVALLLIGIAGTLGAHLG